MDAIRHGIDVTQSRARLGHQVNFEKIPVRSPLYEYVPYVWFQLIESDKLIHCSSHNLILHTSPPFKTSLSVIQLFRSHSRQGFSMTRNDFDRMGGNNKLN